MRPVLRVFRVMLLGSVLQLIASGREQVTWSAENWPEVREQTYQLVWQTINDAYYDPTFGGVDWAAVREKYRGKVPEMSSNEALRDLLTAMVGELRRSHFAIIPQETAVFTAQEQTKIGTVGVEVAWIDDMMVVTRVAPGSAGEQAGLKVGEAILRIADIDVAAWRRYLDDAGCSPARRILYLTGAVTARLQSPVGATAEILLRSVDGSERTRKLTFAAFDGVWSEPVGDFPSVPVECFARCDAGGVAYLRFNVFVRAVMKDFRALVRTIPPDGGLVIDLRGNPGGLGLMAPGISGWLSAKEYSLGTMHMRAGHMGYSVYPQAGAFLGPVAVLIDGGSASTSEILAAGLQEAGRARIFGEKSPGAALPSLFKTLPNGDLLQYAIADLQTPRGVMIEGAGVTPDELVLRTVADLAAGRDPVLERAQRWLAEARQKNIPAPASRP